MSDTYNENTLSGYRTVTSSSAEQFACLTGDYARLHLDQHYAKELSLEHNFVHGLLGASWALGMLTLCEPRLVCETGSESSTALFPTSMILNFDAPVFVGDSLGLRWQLPPSTDAGGDTEIDFAMHNQSGTRSSHGRVAFVTPSTIATQGLTPEPPSFEATPFEADPDKVYYAEDFVEDGPRGSAGSRTMTETDLVAYSNFTGEQNPFYLDREFAAHAGFGQPILPPMLTFCLGFARWLRAFTRVKTPDASFPGHLSDEWVQHQPVFVGDTLTTLHQVISYRPSRSHPNMAIVQIGIQLKNQHDAVVQSSTVQLMMPTRPN